MFSETHHASSLSSVKVWLLIYTCPGYYKAIIESKLGYKRNFSVVTPLCELICAQV